MAILLISCCASVVRPAGASSPGFYVLETGQVLAGSFLDFWLDQNGETALGYPVTPVVERGGRQAQYFQYGVLVLKANGTVSRIKAGGELLAASRSDSSFVGNRRVPSSRAVQAAVPSNIVHQTSGLFQTPRAEIGHAILPLWNELGGLELLGEPITALYRHGSVQSQWFEFGRIDVGPGWIQRAEVGTELARAESVATGPAWRGDMPVFDPSRFGPFAGNGYLPNADQPFDPTRIVIPSIGVDAAIEITTVDDGVMTNPVDPWKVGWYQLFSRPGDWTNVVMAGHRDWWGYGPVVFWNLGNLAAGASIYVMGANGTGATYVVDTIRLVPSSVDPQIVIGDIGYEGLTLITCGGSWTGTEYTDRIIVHARRI